MDLTVSNLVLSERTPVTEWKSGKTLQPLSGSGDTVSSYSRAGTRWNIRDQSQLSPPRRSRRWTTWRTASARSPGSPARRGGPSGWHGAPSWKAKRPRVSVPLDPNTFIHLVGWLSERRRPVSDVHRGKGTPLGCQGELRLAALRYSGTVTSDGWRKGGPQGWRSQLGLGLKPHPPHFEQLVENRQQRDHKHRQQHPWGNRHMHSACKSMQRCFAHISFTTIQLYLHFPHWCLSSCWVHYSCNASVDKYSSGVQKRLCQFWSYSVC